MLNTISSSKGQNLSYVTFDYIPFTNNIADLLMKPLSQDTTLKFTKALGLCREQDTMIQREC